MAKKIGSRNYRKPTGKARKLEGLITENFDDPAAAKKLGYTVDNIETGVTALYKDKKYIKLLEKAKSILDKGLAAKKINLTQYSRGINALLAQPNKLFEKVVSDNISRGPLALYNGIKRIEDQTLRGSQPVLGMEGHHITHQNMMKWFKDLPISRTLETLHEARKSGITTGVVPENLRYLSQFGHKAMSSHFLKGAISGHWNPFTMLNDTKFFSEGFDRVVDLNLPEGQRYIPNQFFKQSDSIPFMVKTLTEQGYNPAKSFTNIALNSSAEKQARDYVIKLLDGADPFTMTNKTLKSKYQTLLKGFGNGANFNNIVSAFAKGDTPKINVSDEVLDTVKALNKDSNVSSSVIEAVVKRSKNANKLKALRKASRYLAWSGIAGLSVFGTASSAAETTARTSIALETGNWADKFQAGLSGFSLANDIGGYTGVWAIPGAVLSTGADFLNIGIDRWRFPEEAGVTETEKTINKLSIAEHEGSQLTAIPGDHDYNENNYSTYKGNLIPRV